MSIHDTTSILVVEDDLMISVHICDVLEDLGFNISGCASCGTEAIALVDQLRPDLAVVDIGLAGLMDGIVVAERLREGFGVPSIFLSGDWTDNKIERAVATRPVGLLAKPFRPSQLLRAVQNALRSDNAAETARAHA